MTRPVIKSFIAGGRIYSPTSRLYGEYTGEREDELFEKGFLGEIEAAEEIEEEVVEATESEEEVVLTNKEIKAQLDALGIEYNARANKTELLALLEGVIT